ncbi:MAG: hypothetical protein JWO03_755 [Bacteroidetes bacterium]|nr:hypothetical protein [Bacteroidota bacterium]
MREEYHDDGEKGYKFISCTADEKTLAVYRHLLCRTIRLFCPVQKRLKDEVPCRQRHTGDGYHSDGHRVGEGQHKIVI